MERCISEVMSYLKGLTDERLKRKDAGEKPVIGEPPIIKIITGTDKANFIIGAHTGAGKTTLGLTLYHKARFGELPGYEVAYVNAREVRRVLGVEDFEKKLLKIIFDHESEEYNKAQESVYATTQLKIDCSSFRECLTKYSHKHSKTLIIVLDELEQALGAAEQEQLIKSWFIETRSYYDKTNKIPVKILVLLPKLLRLWNLLRGAIESAGNQVYVFTEFRELSIDKITLQSYIQNLSTAIGSSIKGVLGLKGFKRLIEVLSKLQTGRYIFPRLWEAISVSVCETLKDRIEGEQSLDKTLEELKGISSLSDIDIDKIIDPVIVGIAEGKPFRSYDRALAIDMWVKGFHELCKKLGSDIMPLKIGYLDFVCKPTTIPNSFVWMTLRKNIGHEDVNDLGKHIYTRVGRLEPGTFNVAALIPEFTTGFGAVRELNISAREERGRRPAIITIKFMYRVLTVEELLSIASMGYENLPIDRLIANEILNELKVDVENMLRPQGV